MWCDAWLVQLISFQWWSRWRNCYKCFYHCGIWAEFSDISCRGGGLQPPDTSSIVKPSAGYRVVRIDLHHFLAGCRKRWLNYALSVLSLSLGFFWVCVVLLTMAAFYVVLFLLFVCSISWLFLLGCQYQCNRKDSSPKWPIMCWWRR